MLDNLKYLIVLPRITKDINEWYTLPLGIMYVSACMKQAGLEVFTINLNHIEGNVKEILEREIIENNINVVLTGGLSGQYHAIKDILDASNKIDKNIVTIVGGGLITSNPEVAMDALESCNFGIIGEGEITVVELCHAINEGGNFEEINGIIFKKGNKYIKTKRRVEISDLDSIPFPDYEGFGSAKVLDKFSDLNGVCQKGVVTMSAGRSCPYKCTFCFHSSGEKYRQRSLESFFCELDFLVNRYDIEFIYIADELFSYNEERVEKFCAKIREYNVNWMINLRVSDVTEKMVELLKKSRCTVVSFGLESADNKILKSMKKNITIEEIENALKIVYKYNIRIVGNLIFGDIEETFETAQNTLKWWNENIQYGINLVFIITYPGTDIYKHAIKEGLIFDEIEYLKNGCPVINISKMSEKERSWVAEKITNSLQMEKEPLDIRLDSFDKNKSLVSFYCKCEFCNTINKVEDVPLFIMQRLNCIKCARRYKVPVFKEMENSLRINVLKLLLKYNKIAFWGMDNYFLELVKDINEIMKNENIFFVDMSEMKQNSKFNGKIIFNPNIIKKENINCIIVAVPKFYCVIKNDIEKECNMYNILSLM